jgi:hypothetical protein
MVVSVSSACAGENGSPADAEPEARLGLRYYALDENGLAIDGYSPVSYFERGKAELGSSEYAVTHKGITYQLTDAQQVETFNADPDAYEPAHGGWCSLMFSGSGKRTRANPESFKIVNGQLLLFWAGELKGNYIDGAKNWETREDEQKTLAKANETWAKIVAGKKRAKIVEFN